MISIVLGSILGAGLVLVGSPFLWPGGRSSVSGASSSGSRAGRSDTLRTKLILAGLATVPLTAFLALSAMMGLAAAAVIHAVLSITVLSVLMGIIAAMVPFLLVTRRAQAKRQANHTVWPDVVDHLVSAVRSGLALPDSVSTLAHAGPAATRAVFAEFETDYRVTGNFSGCVDRLKDRLADPVADRILETLRMAREVGGNDLVTVLRALALYLRQEAAIRGEVRARQGWVMNAAKLGVAAPWIVLLMLGSRPEAAQAYNTTSGVVLIVGGMALSLIAYRLMLAIGHLPEDKRWFA